MLDKACDFINQYRESCIILEKNLEIVIKQEPIETNQFQEPCDIFKGKENTGYRSPWEILAGKKEITVEMLNKETWEAIDFSDNSNDDTDEFAFNIDSNKDGNNKKTNIVQVNKNKVKISKKSEDKTANVKMQRQKCKNNTNKSSRIASSLLEGEFTWTDGQWR